jgi:hypothetical protein
MKRLKLAAFKAKNLTAKNTEKVDQLLGQVLGDCHDSASLYNDEEPPSTPPVVTNEIKTYVELEPDLE